MEDNRNSNHFNDGNPNSTGGPTPKTMTFPLGATEKIYQVRYHSNCNGDENIGFFRTLVDAENAKANFAIEKRLKVGGICCSNLERVEIVTHELL